ncbi:Uncharacterised protein [Mycobacteroides abscessus subsp. abscessus]|nr:Uncharacterised protein [Mycobacteroides abscessus subsp. abscessus]
MARPLIAHIHESMSAPPPGLPSIELPNPVALAISRMGTGAIWSRLRSKASWSASLPLSSSRVWMTPSSAR